MNSILDDPYSFREKSPRSLNIFTIIQVLFGGFSVQFGSLFFWFGMIFTFIFVGQSELVYLFTIDGDWVETTGLVESIERTGVTVNDQPYYKFNFKFTVDGKELSGASMGPRGTIMEGESAAVEYTSLNTDRARIIGTTTKSFPVWTALVLIFPLIGFILMAIGFRENIKALKMLRVGVFTRGKKLSKTATNTIINNRRVYAFEFTFQVAKKPYIATCKTDLTELVEDEELEKILYNPKNPSQNLVYDAMGAAPAIDESGRITQSGILALRYLLGTIIGLLINGFIAFFMYII